MTGRHHSSGPRPIKSVAADRLLAAPGREPARRGVTLSIDGGEIAAIEDALGEADAGGPGCLVIPGLANAHDHGRGLRRLAYGAVDAPLEIWLPQLAATHPAVDPYVIHAVAFARMARAGVTAAVHCHVPQTFDSLEEVEATCRAARDVGIRLAFVVPLRDRAWLAYGGDERFLEEAGGADREAIRRQWAFAPPPLEDQVAFVHAAADACEDAAIQVQLGPYGDAFVSRRLLEAAAEESIRTGRRLHMHCLETRYQREWADGEYEGEYLAWLDRIGFLSPRLTLAHGVWLRRGECELLAERGVTVSVNTSSNLRLRSGRAPVPDFVAGNLRFGFGLDGLALHDDDDMLRELRLARLLHAGTGLDEALTDELLFAGACAVGARAATGRDDFGELAPGRPADLVVLDYDAIAEDVLLDGLTPESDLLLGRATRRHVRSVVAAGREIVRDGEPVGVDLPALERELFAQAAHAMPDRLELLPLLRRFQDALRGYYRAGRHRGPR